MASANFERLIRAVPFVVTGRLLDTIPEIGNPLAAAFSVRRVATEYRGPAVRIRRASDGQEKDIFFVQTSMDESALIEFCAGFDGFVSVWYDQTGRGRHAYQPTWELQPKLVDRGKIIGDVYNETTGLYSGNPTMEFNGSYLTTEWVPDVDVDTKNGTGMLAVAKAGLGIQGQTGTVRKFPAPNVDFPNYPFEKLPVEHDKFNLEGLKLPNVKDASGNLVNVVMYHGESGNIMLYNVDTNTAIDTRVATPFGSPSLTAEVLDTGIAASPTLKQWNAGIRGANNKIYAIPFNAGEIIEIDIAVSDPAQRVRRFAWTNAGTGDQPADGEKWWGGVLGNDNKIYCIPYNARRILVIDTSIPVATATCDTTSSAILNLAIAAKWRNAVLDATTGRIFAMPFDHTGVLTITPGANPLATTHGNFAGSAKYQDGTIMGTGAARRVYGIPWNAASILRIDPANPSATTTSFGNTGMNLHIPGLTDTRGVPSYANTGYGFRNAPGLTFGAPESAGGTTASGTASIEITRVVTNLSVDVQGSGYTDIYGPPWIRFEPNPHTTHPTVVPNMVDDGTGTGGLKLGSITITNVGDGYKGDESVQVWGGKGWNASAYAVVDKSDPSFRVISVQVSWGGTGYFTKPSVQLVGGGGSGATAEVSKMEYIDPSRPSWGQRILEIRVTNGGSGYTQTPWVTFGGSNPWDGKGTFPTVTMTTQAAGHVYGVTITNGGSGYQVEASPSRITIGPPRAGGIQATARISSVDGNGAITGITIVNGGSKYTETPTITITTPGGGTQATAAAQWATDGRLIGVTMTNQGSGYTKPPTVTIASDQSVVGSHRNLGIIEARAEDSTGGSPAPVSLRGEGKWTKAIVGTQGIYGIPYNTWRVLRVSPTEEITTTPISGNLERLEKWSTGVKTANGQFAFGIPYNDSGLLRIDLSTGLISQIGSFRGRWTSGVAAQNGSIYALPADASSVLVIDPRNPAQSETLTFGNLRGFGSKFSDAVATTQGIIYGIPDRINQIIELNPGVAFRAVSIPPPAVVLGSGNAVVFAPTPLSGKVMKLDFSNVSVMPPPTTIVNVSGPPSFADGAVLRGGGDPGNVLVFLPYYNVNDTLEYTGNIGIFNAGTNAWSYAPTTAQLKVNEAPPYPSRSAVSLSTTINAGTAVAWIPKGNVSAVAYSGPGMITYRHDTQAVVISTAAAAQREEPSVEWATSQIMPDGLTVISTIPSGDSAVEKNTAALGGNRWKSWAGVTGLDGRVYTFPDVSTHIEIYDPENTMASPNPRIIDVSLKLEGELFTLEWRFKFAGAVLIPSTNLIYGIPLRSHRILVLNPTPDANGNYTQDNVEGFASSQLPSGDKWWGGALAPNGRIYCVPWDSNQILVLDPAQKNQARRIATFGSFSGSSKWRNAVLANGKIYCIPHNAPQVLVIDPESDSTTSIGTIDNAEGKWSDGVLAPNGKIYCVPWDSADVLVIDPFTQTTSKFSHGQTQRQWSKGMLGSNGKIYCVPHTADQILIIDPESNTCSVFANFRNSDWYQTREKWGGATITPNGTIIGIPQSRLKYLHIQPDAKYFASHRFLQAGQVWERDELPTQRSFRNKPFIISKKLGDLTKNFVLFHTDDGYGVYDLETKSTVYGPNIANGVASFFAPELLSEGTGTFYNFSNVELTTMRPYEGSIGGVRSKNANADLYMSIVNNDLEVGVGNNFSVAQNMFDVIFQGYRGSTVDLAAETGVFSGIAASNVLTAYARAESLGVTAYGFTGNSEGYFEVGRSRGNGIPIINSQYTGYLSELVVLSSDQYDKIADLAENQVYSYLRKG